jgi:glycine hydroxymethyltransferase
VQYGVRKEDGIIDYEELERLAIEHKPKLIIAGGSAYPRFIDFTVLQPLHATAGLHPSPPPGSDFDPS